MEVTKYKKLTRILVFVLIIVMVGMFFMSWGGGGMYQLEMEIVTRMTCNVMYIMKYAMIFVISIVPNSFSK